ncbi:MAG: hypothetical protein MN733_09060 [Nitrososphaera sp.]|nr:hypothetical protein [Nitrososphaera sp.]
MLEIATLISIFVLVSLWEYCMFFYNQQALPYAMGYNIFSMIQWLIVAVALIKMFGWLYGMIGLALCVFVLQYVTHFTLGLIYNFLFKDNPLPALALFSIMVWVTGGLTVALVLFS